jgi:hypothetical protein
MSTVRNVFRASRAACAIHLDNYTQRIQQGRKVYFYQLCSSSARFSSLLDFLFHLMTALNEVNFREEMALGPYKKAVVTRPMTLKRTRQRARILTYTLHDFVVACAPGAAVSLGERTLAVAIRRSAGLEIAVFVNERTDGGECFRSDVVVRRSRGVNGEEGDGEEKKDRLHHDGGLPVVFQR